MKKLLPVLLAVVGLAAGVGAGIALKPAPPAEAAAGCAAPAGAATDGHAVEPGHEAEAAGHDAPQPSGSPCPDATAEADPFKPVDSHAAEPEGDLAFVPIDKPFVVPVFSGEKVIAMVVISLAVGIDSHAEAVVKAVEPRLRDSFLAVMFRHANSGGFDGTFTSGRKMEDLRAALLAAARQVVPEPPVSEVLITEIARQDT